jgi:hypothetical protein
MFNSMDIKDTFGDVPSHDRNVIFTIVNDLPGFRIGTGNVCNKTINNLFQRVSVEINVANFFGASIGDESDDVVPLCFSGYSLL